MKNAAFAELIWAVIVPCNSGNDMEKRDKSSSKLFRGSASRFMRTQHIIIGAALMAAFVIGCSTSSQQTPTVRFGSYVDAAGNGVGGKSSQATFEFENPSASLITCAFHLQPGDPRDAIISIQPYSTNRVLLLVGRTNAETLSVTMMRAGSSRELSVPVP